MKILILGGTGSMGANLVHKLEGGEEDVYVTSRSNHENIKNIIYLRGDAHNISFLDGIRNQYGRFDSIVDFMHYTTKEFKEISKIVLSMTDQYIFLSSSRVYAPSNQPLTEESQLLIDTINYSKYIMTDGYPIAKARSERILQDSGLKNWIIVRPYITYDVYRLQFGIYEKETWLMRVINGEEIIITEDLMNAETSLTYSGDVVDRIKLLIGKKEACGNIFQLTTNESIRWDDVYRIYCQVLEKYGYKVKERRFHNSAILKSSVNLDQLYFDRINDRCFNSSKIDNYTNLKSWTSIEDGLKMCLEGFLENPKFRNRPCKLEGYMDKILGTKTNLSTIKGFKDRLKYFTSRYTPYVSLKYFSEKEIYRDYIK